MNRQMQQPNSSEAPSENPGVSLEKIVARIQQMLDPTSVVTHNEFLIDRVGNRRQYDVVVRGHFAGQPMLGIIECKDHNVRKGPAAIEAFAKKREHLGANFAFMVATKGFTEQALKLAKHDGIGCFSLLPDDPKQVGFSIGEYWYGSVFAWTTVRIALHLADGQSPPLEPWEPRALRYDGKPVINWIQQELHSTYQSECTPGDHTYVVTFDQPRTFNIAGHSYILTAIRFTAHRTRQNKKLWVSWSGDALFDWQTRQVAWPANGLLLSSDVDSDMTTWADYDGEIQEMEPWLGGVLQANFRGTFDWKCPSDHIPDLSSI